MFGGKVHVLAADFTRASRVTAAALAVATTTMTAGCAPTPAAAPRASSETRSAETQAPAQPDAWVLVEYREAANVFEILDNVTNWLSDKCDPEYREYWQTKFGISEADVSRFAEYAAIRARVYPHYAGPSPNDPNSPHDLFGPKKPRDAFAEAFYSSRTLEEAYGKLNDVLPAADIDVIRKFVVAYQPQLQVLLAESRAFVDMGEAMQRRLSSPKSIDFYERLMAFYGIARPEPFTALYVWWPPVKATTANNRAGFLILKYNPERHRDDAAHADDVVVHEMAHFAAVHMPDAKRRALTAAFETAGCEAPLRKALDEPLATVQQRVYQSYVDPAHLDFERPWYGGGWTSAMAKALYPRVRAAYEADGALDLGLMASAGRDCVRTLESVRAKANAK